jgi:hypothetical protein
MDAHGCLWLCFTLMHYFCCQVVSLFTNAYTTPFTVSGELLVCLLSWKKDNGKVRSVIRFSWAQYIQAQGMHSKLQESMNNKESITGKCPSYPVKKEKIQDKSMKGACNHLLDLWGITGCISALVVQLFWGYINLMKRWVWCNWPGLLLKGTLQLHDSALMIMLLTLQWTLGTGRFFPFLPLVLI